MARHYAINESKKIEQLQKQTKYLISINGEIKIPPVQSRMAYHLDQLSQITDPVKYAETLQEPFGGNRGLCRNNF